MPFSFLNPLLLAGVAGAALPLLLHLLGRRRGRERAFAAMDFLLASDRRLAARRKLRNLLLLAARMLLVAAAAVALARPLARGAAATGAAPPVSAVLVLDRTASMAAVAEGESAFERARRLLRRAVAGLPEGSEVQLTTLERVPRRLTEGFVPPAEALRALAAAAPGHTAAHAAPALHEALAAFAQARLAERALYVASDLQRTTWLPGAAAPPLDAPGVELVVLDAGAAEGAANRGLVAAARRAAAGESAPGSDEELEVEALASATAGEPPSGEALLRLVSEGRLVQRAIVRFPGGPRATTVLALPPDLPRGAEAALELPGGDALAADDVRWLYLDRPRRVRVLLGNGAPAPDVWRDELFYLERALEAEAERLALELRDASQGSLGALAQTDVVVLANASRLDARSAAELARFVEEGGGLVVTWGDRAHGGDLARALAPLLPARVTGLLAPAAGEPPLALEAPPSPPHVVAEPFDTAVAAEGLLGARVARAAELVPAEGAEVVLAFTGGRPALVGSRAGRGRVALLATSVDRDWTDLPVKPAYLPLLTRLLLWAGGALEPPRPHAFVSGDRVPLGGVEDLPAAVRLEGPGGEPLEAVEAAPGRLEIESVETPGPYRATVEGRREPGLDFVVNLDPAESDLARAPREALEQALGGRAAIARDAEVAGVEREAETALPALVVLALAFAAEAWLGRRRGEAFAGGAER